MNLRIRDEVRSIKIAVLELYCSGTENAIRPVEFETIYPSSHHAEMAVELIRMSVPNAEIFLLPANADGIQWVIDNDIALVNMSATSSYATEMEELMAENSFLVSSAGNNADGGEGWSAKQSFWCAVGAVGRDTMRMEAYSSYGHGAVRTCTVTDFIIPGTNIHSDGTSGACPYFVGQLAQWFIWFEDLFGRYPSTEATYKFIEANSHDIWDDENPLKCGWGLFRLPHKFTATEIVIDVALGIPYAKRKDHIEGEGFELSQADLLATPQIINDRTMVGSNGLTSQFGISVVWNNDDKTSHYVL
jgi:hypothetical protein